MSEKISDVELIKKFLHLNGLLDQFQKGRQRDFTHITYRGRGQNSILKILADGSTIHQSELVKQLDMRPQSASEMLKKLEKRGLITRQQSETDKRVFDLQITEQGKKMYKQSEEFTPIALSVLTDEEKRQFADILDKLAGEIQSKMQ
jgi:DNA-binding MarR family transcriptional regulator